MNNKKSSFSEIEIGQFISETQYYKIISKNGSDIEVENERSFQFSIGKEILEEGIYSAHQYNQELQVTRTELIEQLTKVGDTVFTVSFNKQPSANAINEAIESANEGKNISTKELKKIVKNAYRGQERILTGYLKKTETGFGRSTVIDLEADRGNNPDWDARIKQVDHRTLNWLIFKNVKYIVKK
ncbi:MAG: hypothetical protein AAFW70_06445 [Cyanobacteria bacterium J06635_10]